MCRQRMVNWPLPMVPKACPLQWLTNGPNFPVRSHLPSFAVTILQVFHQLAATSSGCSQPETPLQFDDLFQGVIPDQVVQVDHQLFGNLEKPAVVLEQLPVMPQMPN